MIYRIETLLRRLRKGFSRNHFMVWLFGMPGYANGKAAGGGHEHGLIMLQIDGLSRQQLQRALENGSMPFCKRLLSDEHYRLHSVYSGVPSSTPAVHGELFYGVRACVPAFRFKRPQDEHSVVMLESDVASEIQQSLEQQGAPLLRGGSAYSDMFDGGAAEASFCASSLGWSSLVPTRNVFKMLMFLILNIVGMMRVIALTLVELLLAVVDVFSGILSGQNVLKEIGFIPVRLATAVLLRELVSVGVKLDAVRGLPVIHANFLGYDEQAHRRGPGSKFAHWSLKGIDRAIARIWRSAKQSEYRDYDMWIYSDHGQERTRSYPDEYGRSIHDAVNEILLSYVENPSESAGRPCDEHLDDPDFQHAHLLGSPKLNNWMLRFGSSELQPNYVEFSIAAMGPLGFVYLEQVINEQTRVAIAQDLVDRANVPMVVTVAENECDQTRARVWTKAGAFTLPADGARVFGSGHPFLEEVVTDTIALCHHTYSGDFILSGWSPNAQAMSFRIENGAHAGPGYNETHAFALLPHDLRVHNGGRHYLRFENLYHAGMRFLGRVENSEQLEAQIVAPRQRDYFRVMTYNVHSCIGMDGRISPRRIARVIAMHDPDVVALQELDSDCPNSMHIDQALAIAGELNMNLEYHPVKQFESGQFGNAILSKHPMKLVDASPLSTNLKSLRPKIAPLDQSRGVMEVEIEYRGQSFSIVNTHLGLTPEERKLQVRDLLGPPRFSSERRPAILCGDFNATIKQYTCKEISKVMENVETLSDDDVRKKTFPGRMPTLRIDHIFVDKQVRVRDVIVPSNHLTKVASDHLPLIADLELDQLVVD